MPKLLRYTPEFKEQSVRLVFAEIGPDESRKAACERLGPRVNVKPVTLYNWVMEAAPSAVPTRAPGSTEELRAQLAAVKKENRELARANEILRGCVFLRGSH